MIIINTNLERIKKNIEEINQFNSTPGEGYTRLTYTEEYRKAANYLIKQFEELNLKVVIDPVGNIRARLEGENNKAPVIMTGSHIDTVLHGGMFDGIAGVIAALEAVRVIIENDIKITNSVEIIIFAEEEGISFNSLVGSKALTGILTVQDLKEIKNAEGLSIYEAAQNYGLKPNLMGKYVLKPEEVKAMLELHVEQSVVLDKGNIPVGIVKAIAGIKWIAVKIEGEGNHAGATPMDLRYDPMIGAAEIIKNIRHIVMNKGISSTVATVGKIKCVPNTTNVIPAVVEFTIDLRDVKIESMNSVEQEIKNKIYSIADYYGLDVEIKGITDIKPVKLSSCIINIIENMAKKLDIKYIKMNSGAGHDAALMSSITDTGMIFVPSVAGRSHVPEEYTNYEDLKIGCDLLLNTIVELAK